MHRHSPSSQQSAGATGGGAAGPQPQQRHHQQGQQQHGQWGTQQQQGGHAAAEEGAGRGSSSGTAGGRLAALQREGGDAAAQQQQQQRSSWDEDSLEQLVAELPPNVRDQLGSSVPVPLGIAHLRLLHLGQGVVRDAFISAALVGPRGRVYALPPADAGADTGLTSSLAGDADGWAATLGYPTSNLTLLAAGSLKPLGLPLPDEAVDLVLAEDILGSAAAVAHAGGGPGAAGASLEGGGAAHAAAAGLVAPAPPSAAELADVLSEIYRVLAPGGEMVLSDLFSSRRLGDAAQRLPVLRDAGLAAATYLEDFRHAAQDAGFRAPRILTVQARTVPRAAATPIALAADTNFFTVMFRLFKMPDGMLEPSCEDYGQAVVYKGTIPGCEEAYMLDVHHTFHCGRPHLVCGNTAAMVGEGGASWLAPHFEVVGDRSVHYGLFSGGNVVQTAASSADRCCLT